MVDRFTGWIEVYRMDGKTMSLIKTLRNLFAQSGVPEELATDKGTSFTSYETQQFLKQMLFSRTLKDALPSSPEKL